MEKAVTVGEVVTVVATGVAALGVIGFFIWLLSVFANAFKD